MGSPAPASPPTLDTAKSKELTAAELAIKRKEISPTTAAAGEASRSEAGKNMAFALRGFTNPASVIYGDQIKGEQRETKDNARQARRDSWQPPARWIDARRDNAAEAEREVSCGSSCARADTT
jgi:hypothetical protein